MKWMVLFRLQKDSESKVAEAIWQGVLGSGVVGINGVLSEDIRVFYPLIVFRTVTFPSHHVPEAAVVDLCFKDLGDLLPLVSIRLEDGRRLVVPRVSREWVRLHKLVLHNQKDQVELGVARWELELVCTLSLNLHGLEGSEPLVQELG
jgi:hypothetical protein